MNERSKARTNKQDEKQLATRTVFVPPSPTVIDEFTRDMCDELTKKGRRAFDNQVVRWAIADFLKLISELATNSLNKKSCEEKP